MMNFMFRKSSSSIASSASKRTLAALTSIDSFLNCHPSTTEVIVARNGAVGVGIRDFSSFRVPVTSSSRVRHFHVGSGPLHFRASVESQAQFAVDDFSYDEEKSSSKGSSDEGLEISKLGIDQEIVSALAKKGIVKLFPIQRAVLEPAMQGRDMIARARTGTGKTLAFGIPIIDKIIQYNNKHGRGRYPLALVMAPTRELAKQVEKEFYDSAPNLDTLCVYGGTPIGRQMGQLDHGVDIVVGTPGRVIDLMKRGALVLSEIQFVVLDEADQMLAVGFEEDVEMILQKLPANRQSLMFSATMPTWIKQLTQKYLKNPLTIDLVGDSDQKLADGITLFSIASDTYGRASIIGPLITEHAKGGKCIVFTATKRDADRLAYAMGRSFRCEALHGDISQNQRERTLSGFRDGSFNVLVATDVAARGLDIPNVDLVIHYELPNTSEIFVHRSGRTGRAGKKGSAILIHSEQQIRAVKTIERGRAPCCEKAHTNKGAWTKEEDQRLVDHIRTHGEGCWRSLPKAAGLLRCGKSCRLRWINYLRPDLKRGNFSKEEDELIIKLHSMVGNKWSLIAGRLPGRTDNEIKNYWNTHIKRKLICRGIDPQTHCSLNATATSASAAAAANSQPELRNSPVPSVPNPEITLTNLRTNEELMARPAASIIRQLNTANSHMEIRNAPLSGITITSRGMELKVRTESIDERNCSSGLTIEDPQQQQERTCQQNQEINLELSIGLPSATMTSSANSAESKLRLLPYQLFSTPASSPVAAARMGSLCSQSSFQKSKYGSFDLTN